MALSVDSALGGQLGLRVLDPGRRSRGHVAQGHLGERLLLRSHDGHERRETHAVLVRVRLGRVLRLDALRVDDLVGHADDGRESDADLRGSALHLATDDERLVVFAANGSGGRHLRPTEVLGKHLRDLVRLVLGLLVTEENEVRLLLFGEGHEPAGDDLAVERVVRGVDANGAVGARAEHGAQHLLGVLRAERDHDDLAEPLLRAGAVLGQPKRGLECVLVVGARFLLEAARVDAPLRRELYFVEVLRVGHPLDGHEDLHAAPPNE
jgi:hypothetical protein